jgi:excisionase family DNA binding protein
LEEAAEILKVTRRSIYNYINEKKLRAVKVGREWRVSHKDLADFAYKGTSKISKE